jgi:hypothetical protein
MAKQINIAIVTAFDDKGARAAQQWLDQFAKASSATSKAAGEQAKYAQAIDKAAASAQRLSSGTAQSAAAQDKAAAAAQRAAASYNQLQRAQAAYEAQQARLARSTGDVARAADLEARAQQRLETILASQNTTTVQTISIQRQLVSVQQQAATAASRVASEQARAAQQASMAASYGQQFAMSMKDNLMGMVGPAAAATAAIGAVAVAADWTQLGAQAQIVEMRFNTLAEAAGTTGDAMMRALRAASGGEISDLNLQLAANRAQLLGVASSADEMAVLLEIARDRAQSLGIDTSKAFDDLVTGLGRGSAEILDNLGIMVSVEEVNKKYAASIGKTVAELSKEERQQALINAVLAQGRETLEKTGGAVESNAAKIARLKATWDNIKAAVGGALADALLPTLDMLGSLANAFDGSYESLMRYADAVARWYGHSEAAVQGNHELVASVLQWLGYQSEAEAAANRIAAARVAEAAANAAASAAQQEATSATATNIPITNAQSAAVLLNANAHREGERDVRAFSVANTEATYAALADAAAKQEQAAKTELMTAQAEEAVAAFMRLHPEIDASGVASLAAAGKVDPLLAQLVMARIRASEAIAELARFNALAGVQAQTSAQIRAAEAADMAQIRSMKSDMNKQIIADAKAAAAAERERQKALGNYAPAIERAKNELSGLTKGSAAYIEKQTEIIRLEQQAASAAKRNAGGGGKAKVSEAEKIADQLVNIEQSSGKKLEQIAEQTQTKIADIERKYAEKRLAQIRSLNDDIARSSSKDAYDRQINDFEQFGKDMSDEQRAMFQAREAAEAAHAERVRRYQEDARREAENGDAELAAERLRIREEESRRQMEIEQAAAKANLDTAGKQADAIAREAAEASAAAKADADTQIAIAEAKAAERAGAMDAEKQAVIAAAQEQSAQVIAAAEEQAAKVKGASESQKAVVIGNLQAQAAAANSWADAIAAASRRAQSAMNGVSGPSSSTGSTGGGTAAAGGGTFVTSGPATLTVGDNPGGVELVQVTPISGTGQTRVGGNMARLAGGGTVVAGGGGQGASSSGSSVADAIAESIKTFGDAAQIVNIIKPFVAANKGAAKLLNEYKITVESAVGSLLAIQDLRARLTQPQPALDPAVIERLRDDTDLVLKLMLQVDTSATSKVRVLTKYLELETAAIDILNQAIELRGALDTPTPPIDMAYVAQLNAESQAVTQLLLTQMMPMQQRQLDLLKRYADTASTAVQILTDVADLRTRLSENTGTPFDMGLIRGLAMRAAEIARIVDMQIVPYTERQAAAFEYYATTVASAVQTLIDVADLRTRLSEDTGTPFDMGLIKGLAMRAGEIVRIVQSQAVPMTEQTAAALERYADAAGSAVQILVDVADLRTRLSENTGSPFNMTAIVALANEAKQVAQIVRDRLLPTTEQQAESVTRYADAASSAVQILSDTIGLRRELSDLGTPISAATAIALANEAKQVAQIVRDRLLTSSEQQATDVQRYADVMDASVSILTAMLSLNREAAEAAAPISVALMTKLAADAKQVAQIVRGQLLATSEQQATDIQRYADAVDASVSVLTGMIDLQREAADAGNPISTELVTRLAADAKRITQLVRGQLLPTTEQQADAVGYYADAVDSSVAALSSTLGLSARMFVDYQSPSDAQINRVVADANRIVKGIDAAARAYSTSGLDAAQRFGEATGSIIGAFKDQLLFAQALQSGDFAINAGNLATFEKGLSQTLSVAQRLGAQAAAIPAANIEALQSTTAALNSAYESMIKLSAVPFGNIGALTAGLGGSSTTSNTVINVTIQNPPATLNVPQLVQTVKQSVVQALESRR